MRFPETSSSKKSLPALGLKWERAETELQEAGKNWRHGTGPGGKDMVAKEEANFKNLDPAGLK